MCGVSPESIEQVHDGRIHLHNALKFVTVKTEANGVKSGIMCLGGPWDAELDGGQPSEYVVGVLLLYDGVGCFVVGGV